MTVLKLLYPNQEKWNTEFLPKIQAIFEEYMLPFDRQYYTSNFTPLFEEIFKALPILVGVGFAVDKDAGTITIYAKKFSTYAVAYAVPSNNGSRGGSYAPGHTVTSDLDNITKVTVDGKTVDSRYYTVTGGSVYLSGEFMKTLPNGKHTVKLYQGIKTATGTFTVVGSTAVAAAPTGDTGVVIYGVLTVGSVLGMGWLGRKKHGAK